MTIAILSSARDTTYVFTLFDSGKVLTHPAALLFVSRKIPLQKDSDEK
jgi:hypothetical protein